MFAEPKIEGSKPQRLTLLSSLAAHALLLAWLLYPSAPQLLNPSSVAQGHNGHVAKLYFPSPSPDESDSSSPNRATEVYRHQRLGHEKLILKQTAALAKLSLPTPERLQTLAQDEANNQSVSKSGHGAAAGLAYGSLPGGPVYGNEIRPALPVATVDPVVYPWELPDAEGNVIVEITIDARGEIVDKTILHSMGQKLDDKFLAALKSWHFQPATKNGVAIASKQDAVFHFGARG